MIDLFNYSRRKASVVNVGNTPLGGDNPVRVQSMTTTQTTDTEGSVAQTERIVDAGGAKAPASPLPDHAGVPKKQTPVLP